jgi:3-oxoacyl-[acyl-carrier-protein] synthase II
MKKRVVVTGIGVVSPIGIGVENFWENLLAGKGQ